MAFLPGDGRDYASMSPQQIKDYGRELAGRGVFYCLWSYVWKRCVI